MGHHPHRKPNIGAPSQYPSERRFGTLDAMRGIAAISVVLFHFLPSGVPLFHQAFYGVDFFFCLSGVILFHSYQHKIQLGMTFTEFLKRRLIRLYPFYCLGGAFGVVLLLCYMISASVAGFREVDYILSICFGMIFIPYPNHASFPLIENGMINGVIFPINVPAWSLFFELLASGFLFIVIRARLNLTGIVITSFLIWACALLHYGTENMGWGIYTFLGGFPRTALTFFLGVMIYRWFSRNPFRLSINPWALLIMMAIAFSLPPIFRGDMGREGDALLFLLFTLVMILMGLAIDGEGRSQSVFAYLGRISYGIYVVHWPVYHLLLVLTAHHWAWARGIEDAPIVLAAIAGVVVWGVAHFLTLFVDEPMRRWLGAPKLAEEGQVVAA